MAEPLVSVLIPAFNRDWCLEYAVASCVGQTYRNIEVVVYDDGSTDTTPDLVARLGFHKDSGKLRYLRSDANQGIPYARNALLKAARGDYACWLDTDDLSNIFRVEVLVDAMERYKPSYVRSGTTTYKGFGLNKTWKGFPLLAWHGGPSSATSMFRPKEAVAYDTALKYGGEDSEWEARMCLELGTGIHVPLALYMIGRTPREYRLSTLYRLDSEKFNRSVEECKAKTEKTLRKIEAQGRRKQPTAVPWDFLEKHLRSWYLSMAPK